MDKRCSACKELLPPPSIIIYPLRGKTVCGLHVENNLRAIPQAINLKGQQTRIAMTINIDAYVQALKLQRNAALDEGALLAARLAEVERENKLLVDERDRQTEQPRP